MWTHVLLVAAVSIISGVSVGMENICSSLTTRNNVKLECKLNDVVVDCTNSQKYGTIVTYDCTDYFTPFANEEKGHGDNILRCTKDGVWKGLKTYEAFRCKEDCGKASSSAKPLIVNGLPSNRTNWPWNVGLFRKSTNGKSWLYICGGSLIRNQIVLTSAHCVAEDHITPHDAQDFRVVLAPVSSSFTENIGIDGTQIHKVKRIYISSNYDPKKDYQADIAVLHLMDTTEFNTFVSPICLPNDYVLDANAIRPGVAGDVVGFGVTEDGIVSKTLRWVSLIVKSNAECYSSLHRVLSESQFCAGNKRGDIWQTVCNGDSGGGLIFLSNAHQKYFIHGIVSSGDADSRRGVCQNNAAFVRVYPFVFWIRDVIEEISGEIARDLHQSAPYPYTLEGTEIELVGFKTFPREWENRITHLTISYAMVDMNSLLTSLEFGKHLTYLNLTAIKIENLGRIEWSRVILPHLTTFKMDILEKMAVIENSKQIPDKVLKDLLFFDKEYKDWSIKNIVQLKTNIFLNVGIHKLIHLNIQKGDLFLNKIGDAEEIVKNALTGDSVFILKHLGLHHCNFDFTFLKSTYATSIQSLTIDNVDLKVDALIEAIKNLQFLQTLSITTRDKIILGLDILPKGLKQLAISKPIKLVYSNDISNNRGSINLLNGKIIFSEKTQSTQRLQFKQLDSLCCDFCNIDSRISMNADTIFPALKFLLVSSNQTMNFTKLLRITTLQNIYLYRPNPNTKFGIDASIFVPNTVNSSSTFVVLKRLGDKWIGNSLSQFEFERASFSCSGKSKFISSYEDFTLKRRLKSFEREALKTNVYNFNGTGIIAYSDSKKPQFPGIPKELQKNLKNIVLISVEIVPEALTSSIEYCRNLQSLILKDATFLKVLSGSSRNFKEYEYKIEKLILPNMLPFEYVYEYVDSNLENVIIPYPTIGRFTNTTTSNPLYRLFKIPISLYIRKGEGVIYSYNTKYYEYIEAAQYILGAMKFLNSSHVLSLRNWGIELAKLYKLYNNDIMPHDFELEGLYRLDLELAVLLFEKSPARYLPKFLFRRIFEWQLDLSKVFSKFTTCANLETNELKSQVPRIQTIAVSLLSSF